jgi:hypothetical protein
VKREGGEPRPAERPPEKPEQQPKDAPPPAPADSANRETRRDLDRPQNHESGRGYGPPGGGNAELKEIKFPGDGKTPEERLKELARKHEGQLKTRLKSR